MLSQQERVIQMKRKYMQLRAQGMTPIQIAHHFDLASGTVYAALQEIATANGVSRDSLLLIPRSKHLTHERRYTPVAPVDPTEFRKRFQAANIDLVRVIESSVAMIDKHEEIATQIEKEEAAWSNK